jgi:hypothetical protein
MHKKMTHGPGVQDINLQSISDLMLKTMTGLLTLFCADQAKILIYRAVATAFEECLDRPREQGLGLMHPRKVDCGLSSPLVDLHHNLSQLSYSSEGELYYICSS